MASSIRRQLEICRRLNSAEMVRSGSRLEHNRGGRGWAWVEGRRRGVGRVRRVDSGRVLAE